MGLSQIKKSKFFKSIDNDMKKPLSVVLKNKRYSLSSDFVKKKEIFKI